MLRAGLIIASVFFSMHLLAQTPTKEAMNNFALYTSKKDFSELEKARKTIDDAYKTRKDSLSYRNNLIRSLVYSSLAYADSTRKLKYVKDPIEEAMFSFQRLKNPKLNDEHMPEINYVKKQLAKAHLIKANRALAFSLFPEAYRSFLSVDSLDKDNFTVKYNLAVVSEKLGYYNRAIRYYEQLIKDKQRVHPDYYLALSNLYEATRNNIKSLEVLEEGRKAFPGNKDILFKEINIYTENGSFSTVEKLLDDALEMDPDNVSLNYLAGFTYESIQKKNKAEQAYKKMILLEQNSYEGHYALGLLYLDLYLNKKNKREVSLARRHLVKAGEINPNSVNVLKSLAILYSNTGNMIELQKVNNKLKQFIFN
jgi:tetratricopeptide (TPR) repeat protein